KWIGTVPTIFIVGATGLFGVIMARLQGFYTIYRFKSELNRGVLPAEEIFDGACVLVGAAFLLTPGLITDFLGFALLIPQTRFYIKRAVRGKINRMILDGNLRIWRR
ncbi:MAG: membrane protein FxsA, partial [Firmicutes bacterium HGW-Firmicutes-13]